MSKLKGSKTHENLKHAFAGESQANRRYLYFRVTEICDGCRRCHRLCPSLDFMLDRIDANDGDVAKVSPGDYRKIVDLCYQCKLCFNHCPYTPPHRDVLHLLRELQRAASGT